MYDGFNQIAKSNKSAASSAEPLADGTAPGVRGRRAARRRDDRAGRQSRAGGFGFRQPGGGHGVGRQRSSRGRAGRGRRLEGRPQAAHRCGAARQQLPHAGQGQRGRWRTRRRKVATGGAGCRGRDDAARRRHPRAGRGAQPADRPVARRRVGRCAFCARADPGEGPCGRGRGRLRAGQPAGGQGRHGRGGDRQGCRRSSRGATASCSGARDRSAARAASSAAARRSCSPVPPRSRRVRSPSTTRQSSWRAAREQTSSAATSLVSGQRLGQLGGQLDRQRRPPAEQWTGEGRQGEPDVLELPAGRARRRGQRARAAEPQRAARQARERVAARGPRGRDPVAGRACRRARGGPVGGAQTCAGTGVVATDRVHAGAAGRRRRAGAGRGGAGRHVALPGERRRGRAVRAADRARGGDVLAARPRTATRLRCGRRR